MRFGWLGVARILAAGPALASPCSGEIDTLSKRVQEQSRAAISASTAGQADAAARGGQGTTGAGAGAASERPTEKSAQAGQGADKAQAAKVALDEARTADGKGCEDSLARARKALDAAP